ncbi:hypothetical protein PSCLAVI8L_10104 [Pseudoclavibacter sp. 8L]|nr:hypothetical protein PSCLAVI8L_10104 [Pseudoclavibacter sp. 8L]
MRWPCDTGKVDRAESHGTRSFSGTSHEQSNAPSHGPQAGSPQPRHTTYNLSAERAETIFDEDAWHLHRPEGWAHALRHAGVGAHQKW